MSANKPKPPPATTGTVSSTTGIPQRDITAGHLVPKPPSPKPPSPPKKGK